MKKPDSTNISLYPKGMIVWTVSFSSVIIGVSVRKALYPGASLQDQDGFLRDDIVEI